MKAIILTVVIFLSMNCYAQEINPANAHGEAVDVARFFVEQELGTDNPLSLEQINLKLNKRISMEVGSYLLTLIHKRHLFAEHHYSECDISLYIQKVSFAKQPGTVVILETKENDYQIIGRKLSLNCRNY